MLSCSGLRRGALYFGAAEKPAAARLVAFASDGTSAEPNPIHKGLPFHSFAVFMK